MSKIQEMRTARDNKLNKLLQRVEPSASTEARVINEQSRNIRGQHELNVDNFLHEESNGPYHLSDPAIAKEVIDSWRFLHNRGEVYVYVICAMSNHVHVVIGCPPNVDRVNLSNLIGRTKSFTARQANIILGTPGQTFWNDSFFDTTVRKGKFERAVWYVLNNPVKAGLVKNWREWKYTWLNPDFDALFR